MGQLKFGATKILNQLINKHLSISNDTDSKLTIRCYLWCDSSLVNYALLLIHQTIIPSETYGNILCITNGNIILC